jgi:molybdenum cofactor cytidylyltransferase
MIFSEFDLDQAEGALLAHSLRIEGRKLPKGKKLSGDDLALLAKSGLRKITGIKLEENDAGENDAAAALADRLMGVNLSCGPALTGRCNLIAQQAGLAVIDADKLLRLNRVDEAVTVASIPPFDVVEAGQIVATVKIIPFAIPRPVLDTCLAVGSTSIIRVLPFLPLRVGVIASSLPGLPEAVVRSTFEVTRLRVESLGGHVVDEVEVSHEVGQISRAIKKVAGMDVDLILISGASATFDRRDVVPQALLHAGGSIDHFGMPVDPGNLMLLGKLDKLVVIDMPGCGRSARLNGLDLVLRRLFAGITVSGDDMMALGAGGLLKDMGCRPMPRRAEDAFAPSPRQARVAAIVLAAGRSVRMKGQNKLLAKLDGQPMVRHVAESALASKASHVVVVTGYQEEEVRQALQELRVSLVSNPHFAEGLSGSLKAGLHALPHDIDAAIVLLGDMPLISTQQIDNLIGAFDPDEGRSIIVPTMKGKRGNPVLWGRRFFGQILAIEGDVGARHLIGENMNQVFEVEMDDEAVLTDIDKPEDLSALSDHE